MPVIYGLTLLLVFQLVGEVGVRALGLPIPGPVVGMLLLLIAMIVRQGVPESLDSAANGLLSHLSLLFVPAGVGLIVYFERMRAEWLPITMTLLLSTMLTMAVTALVMRALTCARDRAGETDGRD